MEKDKSPWAENVYVRWISSSNHGRLSAPSDESHPSSTSPTGYRHTITPTGRAGVKNELFGEPGVIHT